MYEALIIDSSGRPVDLVEPQKALSLMRRGHFVVRWWDAEYHAIGLTLHLPKIISLRCYVPLPDYSTRVVTNHILFLRDKFTCQYCGLHKFGSCGHEDGCSKCLPKHMKLTRDHMKPVSRFEGKDKRVQANTWSNCTTACTRCNGIKDDRLPYEAKMYPLTTPKRPTGIIVTLYEKVHDEEQLEFVRPFIKGMMPNAV